MRETPLSYYALPRNHLSVAIHFRGANEYTVVSSSATDVNHSWTRSHRSIIRVELFPRSLSIPEFIRLQSALFEKGIDVGEFTARQPWLRVCNTFIFFFRTFLFVNSMFLRTTVQRDLDEFSSMSFPVDEILSFARRETGLSILTNEIDRERNFNVFSTSGNNVNPPLPGM